MIFSSESPEPRAIDRGVAVQVVAAMLGGRNLTLEARKNELVITNPHDPEKGKVYVDRVAGLVSWKRPAWDFWGVLEGYPALEPADDESTVSIGKIVASLTEG